MKLTRDFYLQSGLTVARDLIGKRLVHRTPEGVTAGIIVEAEAYMGRQDPAAHSYRASPRGRTAIQYGPGGFAYIYTIYGLHLCMNVVAGGEDVPEAVLIRALEPVEGLALMEKRRGTDKLLSLCSGPGKLSQAMGIQKSDYGADLCGDSLYIEATGTKTPPVAATKRIGIDYAGEAAGYLWRFILRDSPFVSVPPRSSKGS